MSKAGANYLMDEIGRIVDYCAREYNMTWAEAIGCLSMAMHYYSCEAFRENGYDGYDDVDNFDDEDYDEGVF